MYNESAGRDVEDVSFQRVFWELAASLPVLSPGGGVRRAATDGAAAMEAATEAAWARAGGVDAGVGSVGGPGSPGDGKTTPTRHSISNDDNTLLSDEDVRRWECRDVGTMGQSNDEGIWQFFDAHEEIESDAAKLSGTNEHLTPIAAASYLHKWKH